MHQNRPPRPRHSVARHFPSPQYASLETQRKRMRLLTLLRNGNPISLLFPMPCALFLAPRGWHPPSIPTLPLCLCSHKICAPFVFITIRIAFPASPLF